MHPRRPIKAKRALISALNADTIGLSAPIETIPLGYFIKNLFTGYPFKRYSLRNRCFLT